MPEPTPKVEPAPEKEKPTPPAKSAVAEANAKLDALKHLGGKPNVNPFHAIAALNKAIADLESTDVKVKANAEATIRAVTADGKWVPAPSK